MRSGVSPRGFIVKLVASLCYLFALEVSCDIRRFALEIKLNEKSDGDHEECYRRTKAGHDDKRLTVNHSVSAAHGCQPQQASNDQDTKRDQN